MVRVSGPSNHDFVVLERNDESVEQKFFCEAKKLGDALKVYCTQYNSQIRAYDGSLPALPFKDGERKYFFYSDSTLNICDILVDVHIMRNGTLELCPKQDLDFSLESGDEVIIGMLVC